MGSKFVNANLSISDRYLKKKINYVSEEIRRKVIKDMNNVFRESVEELRESSPRDTTTVAERQRARRAGEVVPFAKHGERSADAYSYELNKSSTGKTIKGKILNQYAYIQFLNEGTMDKTGLLVGARVKERTSDGKFSEAAPNGDFLNKIIKKVFLKYGYHIDKSIFVGKIVTRP